VPTLSIVIPAYNESSRLAHGYERLAPFLDHFGLDEVEVVVIDDGSTDDTMARAGEIYGRLPHSLFLRTEENNGKGAAIRLGLSVASGEVIITADADMAIHPQHYPAVVEALASASLVAGDRAHGGRISYDSRLRTMAGGVFNRVVRHFTGVTLRDTQCGCKGFTRPIARLLALLGYVDRFAFDVEMLYVAERLDLRVATVAVSWDDVAGSSVRVGADSRAMLHDIRTLRDLPYENPVVELAPGADVEMVARLARDARVQGPVLARGTANDLVVLPRDGALAGISIASALNGVMRTTRIDELRGREFIALN
jgi:dolichyl-phosphate beta-glucosyltransferase